MTSSLSDALVLIVFLALVGLIVVTVAWLSFRQLKLLSDQNFRLTQCNLALSEKPGAVPVAMTMDQSHQAEVQAERDGVLAANGVIPQGAGGPRRRTMES